MADEHVPHAPGELCDAGLAVYAQAVREGRVQNEAVAHAPCLADLGLLRPEPTAPATWLRPAPPAIALASLLASLADETAEQRRREIRLATAFAPLLRQVTEQPPPEGTRALRVLDGLPVIEAAIDRAVNLTSGEVLTIQPGGIRPPDRLMAAVPLHQGMLSRGARMRTLYQHTTRYSQATVAHYEELVGDVEVRTLDEVSDRLLVFDRRVAFIPASGDRTAALEIRQPTVVEHLVGVFHHLWRRATPMHPNFAPQPAEDGISIRQRAVATLLAEGLTDNEIAVRLGMNVRTARVHIAKLSTTLGSRSRTQLGYLISRSGMLEHDRSAETSGATTTSERGAT
ncbi:MULTISPECIES: helix-turn-helix transcriptional regulator [unclassified Streptomyces]|uniref:helix-turn-helix transcriptional regulator n=1 Tax=unclassified Streptomyces TaxID=2593676 RepID=UPI0033EB8FEA